MSLLGGPSSLSTSLIGLIALALAVVLLFNLLQGRQRRAREAARRAETTAAAPSPADAAGAVLKRGVSTPAATGSGGSGAQRVEPSLSQAPSTAVSAPATLGATDASSPASSVSGVDLAARLEPTWSEPSSPSTSTRPEPAPSQAPAVDPMPATSRSAADLVSMAAAAAAAAGLGKASAPSAGDAPTTPVLTGPSVAATPQASADAEPAPAAPAAPADNASLTPSTAVVDRLDPRLDCIVQVHLPAPTPAHRLVQAAAVLRMAGSKPILVEADGAAAGWLHLHAGLPALQRVRVGLLLANRSGPASASEFDEFARLVTAFAQASGATETRLPDRAPVLEHARQVDEFCAQLDTLIGVNVKTTQPMNSTALAALALELGLTPHAGQRYVSRGDQGDVRFSMSGGQRPDLITFLLDVPRAASAGQPWTAMLACARRCAQIQSGILVDDALRPLTDSAVAAVARQLESHYQALDAAGMPAGSPAALRVFN